MNSFIRSSRKKRRVLVVDDEAINRELLETILSLNYEVTGASSGVEAMERLRSAEEPFSLILLDLLMPLMSGFQVLEACKADESLKHIPIIVMTSEKSAEVRSIRMGADDFIPKPYRMPEVILARCERIIELSEEKALIKSIEKDKVTRLYIKVFFYAYIRRLLPDIRIKMDAVVLRLDGLDNLSGSPDYLLKKTADLIKEILLGTKGFACRLEEDNTFLAYCRHREDYEELAVRMQEELSDIADVRLRAGVLSIVDKEEPIEEWFAKAGAACDSVPEDRHTKVC